MPIYRLDYNAYTISTLKDKIVISDYAALKHVCYIITRDKIPYITVKQYAKLMLKIAIKQSSKMPIYRLDYNAYTISTLMIKIDRHVYTIFKHTCSIFIGHKIPYITLKQNAKVMLKIAIKSI